MAYKINGNDLYSDMIVKDLDTTSFCHKNLQITIKRKRLSDKVEFYDIASHLDEDVEIYNDSYSSKGLMLGFMINGQSSFKAQNISLDLSPNSTYIQTLDSLINTKTFYKTGTTRVMGIVISPDMANLFLKNSGENLKLNRTNLNTKIYLDEIINTNYDDCLGDIFLQGKIFDILYNEFSSIQKQTNTNKIFLSNFDIAALNKAKDILISSFKNPPCISKLAKMVHLNEFKLKVGFKQLFDKTAFEIVREQKMLHAKDLLQNSDMNIFEISNFLGFKHQSHFTKMFYNEFNILPKEFIKNRKFYI
ncbi:transcriptional regulator, AraC family [Campylobacter blaseri]|uniref:HTH araC/xylS-type domain-containing protein n=1 Tax=Campylobacter blaseri TaxID=2042961 RepID=A0A2P8R457_9BACT|nr:AraC family transcriptional regulator [Campylobacter blaseri]PSM53290.1 hypothetical protein CQ405_01730 [Campylobacter blaseri]PSM54756.1 hypothetical protein CRN67_01730 [Campylobacter blaseri]QKF86762.1 transcriptional regulator, AraC family [Campylobacter blaseri]